MARQFSIEILMLPPIFFILASPTLPMAHLVPSLTRCGRPCKPQNQTPLMCVSRRRCKKCHHFVFTETTQRQLSVYTRIGLNFIYNYTTNTPFGTYRPRPSSTRHCAALRASRRFQPKSYSAVTYKTINRAPCALSSSKP